jgi:hypothetical protein
MKNSERFVWTLLALGAFAAGSRGHFNDSSSGSQSASPGGKAAGDHSSSSGGRASGPDGDLTPPQRATLVERNALASPLRTGRFMGMMAALDQVKPDTWPAMWEEFKRQTTEDGRVHEVEWSLFMNRVGEVDGADAMAFFEKNGQPEYTFNRREILLGWAAADPKAAIAWMDSQPGGSPNQELQATLLSGVVQADPDLALGLLAKVPSARSAGMAGDLVGELIQAKGIQWTMDHVATLASSGETNAPYVNAMAEEVSQRVQRMAWLAGDSKAVDEWNAKRGIETSHSGEENPR